MSDNDHLDAFADNDADAEELLQGRNETDPDELHAQVSEDADSEPAFKRKSEPVPELTRPEADDWLPEIKENETHIAVWGTTQSGKTTFLASLIHIFKSLQRRQYNNLRVNAANRVAGLWIEQIQVPLFANGKFPAGTEIAGGSGEGSMPKIRAPRFIVSDENGNELMTMTFIDGPGEMFRDPTQFAQRYNLTNPLNYMRQVNGLVMLVDPTRIEANETDLEYKALIRNLIELRLDEAGNARFAQLKVPVAFVLTKCDIYEYREAVDDVLTFLRQRGMGLMEQLESECSFSRWFPSSALGFEPNQPINTYIRWDGTPGIRDLDAVKPINVAEPFMWLLEHNKVIPTQSTGN
jgi:GTPase SAR1 family protein